MTVLLNVAWFGLLARDAGRYKKEGSGGGGFMSVMFLLSIVAGVLIGSLMVIVLLRR